MTSLFARSLQPSPLRAHLRRVRGATSASFTELHRLGVTIASTGVFLGFFVAVVVEGRASGGVFLAILLAVLATELPRAACGSSPSRRSGRRGPPPRPSERRSWWPRSSTWA